MRRPPERNAHSYVGSTAWDTDVTRLQIVPRVTKCLAEVALLRHRGLTETQIATSLAISHASVHERLRRLHRDHRLATALDVALFVERALR